MSARLSERVFSFVVAATVVALVGCSNDQKDGDLAGSNPPIQIVPKESVGKIRVAMSASNVVATLGEPQRRIGNALEYTKLGFAVVASPDGMISAVMCGDVTGVNGPLVKAFTGKTAEGIGMLSTKEELEKAYGPADDSKRFIAGEESLHYISRGLTFTLEGGRVHHIIVRFGSGIPDRTINLEPPPSARRQ